MKLLRASFLLACIAATTASAKNDWGRFRGPNGTGVAETTGMPTAVDDSTTVWKIELGKGWSSPVLYKDMVIVTAETEPGKRAVIALSAKDGKQIWKYEAPYVAHKIHNFNSFASSSPFVDDGGIYVSWSSGTDIQAIALDHTGKLLWQVRPGLFSSKHGFCSSPIIYKDKVIVNCDHDGDGYIVALSRTDGKELWRIVRPNNTRSYCVPIIRELVGRTQMVLSGTKCVTSYNPDDGKLIWIIDGPTEQYVASLVHSEKTGLLYMTGGFPDHHLLAIKPDGQGNVTNTHIVWRTNKGVAYVPSPIISGDYFLIVSDSGVGHCFDAKTGEIKWEERLREHHASLVGAEGRVYFVNDQGVLRVVKPGAAYELLAESEVGEKVFASPAMSEGQIFIRGDKSLTCYGKRTKVTAAQR